VSQQDVLYLLFYLFRVGLEFYKVLDVDQSLERVLFNFSVNVLHVCACLSEPSSRLLSGCGWGVFALRLQLGCISISLRSYSAVAFSRDRNLAVRNSVLHPILLKWPIVGGSIFKGEDTMTILEVLLPVALIL
jgi:hypothetical protein